MGTTMQSSSWKLYMFAKAGGFGSAQRESGRRILRRGWTQGDSVVTRKVQIGQDKTGGGRGKAQHSVVKNQAKRSPILPDLDHAESEKEVQRNRGGKSSDNRK